MAPCPRVEKKTLKGVQALGINPASGNGIGVVGGDKKTVVSPPSCLILVVFLLSGSPLPNKKRLKRELMLLASQPRAWGRGKDPRSEAVAAIKR